MNWIIDHKGQVIRCRVAAGKWYFGVEHLCSGVHVKRRRVGGIYGGELTKTCVEAEPYL